jgi:TatD DNase family protein
MTGRRGAPPPPPEPLPAPVVDAHTHLDACGCTDADSVGAAMDRANAVGVRKVVTVADDLTSARWVTQAIDWHDDLYGAVALHPTRVAAADFTDDVKAELEKLAGHSRVRAIGETGLDYYWDFAPPAAEQREAFAWHIALAERLGKPVMIHDRDAHDDVISVLKAERPQGTVIFHCFSGDAAMARLCADAGWMLSFAGPVTFRNASALREAASAVPLEQILVETDAPFLTPHPHRGRPNEPYLLPWTVRAIADLHGRPLDEVCAAIEANAERVFGPW